MGELSPSSGGAVVIVALLVWGAFHDGSMSFVGMPNISGKGVVYAYVVIDTSWRCTRYWHGQCKARIVQP